MAKKAEQVVGAVFEFDVDDLKKGLQEAKTSISNTNAEFKKSVAGMDNWRKTSEGLGKKITQLTKNIDDQELSLVYLKEQYRRVAEEQGTSSQAAIKLDTQIKNTEASLKQAKTQLNKYAQELANVKNKSNETKKITIDLDKTMNNLSDSITKGAVKGFKSLATAAAGYVTSLVAVTESTREYRQDISKLSANADSANVSLDTTNKVLKDLNAISGETDSNIEAISNLLMAGFDDNNLSAAVETLSDAVIRFPDTLKVESLADSIQESIKQMDMGNNATGQYAELLERLGYNLETVTEKFSGLNTLEEKQSYLLDLVNKKIGGTTTAYRDQHKELVNAADAQFELNESMSQLGAKAEPAISLVKSEVAGLIKELIAWSDENFDVTESTQNIIKNVKGLASTYLPPLINVVKTIYSVGKQLLPLILSVGTGIVAYNKAVTISTALTKGYTIVSTTLKAGYLLLTGSTIAATKAQLGLNASMVANPVGLVVGAVAALTVGLIALSKKQNEEIDNAKSVTKAVKEQKKSYDDLVAAKQEDINIGLTQMDHNNDLWLELQKITDENGKIQKGYENRATFITGALSEALGLEIKIVDGQIQKYGELTKSINDTIAAKKAEIILAAQEELYNEAILKRQETLIQYNQTAANIAKLEAERDKLEEQRAGASNVREQQKYSHKIALKNQEIDESNKQYKTLEDLLSEYNYNIAAYETNATLIHNGEYDKVQAKNWETVKNYEDTTKAKIKHIEEQIAAEKSNLEILKKDKAKYSKEEYESMVKSSKDKIKNLEDEMEGYKSTIEEKTPEVIAKYNTLMKESLATITNKKVEFKDAGDGQIQAYVDGAEYKKPVALEQAETLANDIIAEFEKEEAAKEKGKNVTKGLGNGIEEESNKKSFMDKVKGVGSKVLSWLHISLVLGSPSKETKKYGKWIVQGLGIGIDNEKGNLLNQIKSLGSEINGAFKDDVNLALNTAKGSISGSIGGSSSGVSASNSGNTTNVVNNFYQTNNSPKALSQLEIYRQTHNLLNKPGGA